jgi:transposase-like protein
MNEEGLSEFFKYPPEIRKAIYTTNVIESLNYQLRKVKKTDRHFRMMMLYSRYCIWQ